MKPTMKFPSAAILLATGLLLITRPAQAADPIDCPKLDITYEQAQTLFGGKNAKMIVVNRDSSNAGHPAFPGNPSFLYLIDFSNPPCAPAFARA